ncbi:MAG: hypothetical protein IIB09_03160, partial [Bacteroidetes bacterium]|nr:hypothetical protein [Bacteroidota bacterium]
MRGLFLGLLCLVISSSTRAQQARVQALSHAVRAQGGSGLDVLSRPAAPFYDVVALRVEFQPDTSRFTTGDGTFSDNLYRGLEVSIDPLPHDAGYFQAHLDFVSHYVEHVSDGRTVVNTHLVPEIVRVSLPMAAYSPIGEESDSDSELSKLAALVREAWTLASAQSGFDLSGFNPATTAFVLFHAGAGRDIELTGTSLDRTPQDLPSLFFDAATLQRLSPGPPITFNGFTVQSTMVIPETESRLGRNFITDEDFVAEFSINGFLAASFFSYLGVPDLFNAETGESAIGSFGLMDPLGIFAFNGLFPPEPSAWTKQYLGWSNPVEVAPGTDPQEVTLGAVSALGFSDAIRVPISGAAYFLVENRQRAAESDDLVLSIYRDGDIVEQRIPLDAEDFDRFNVDAFEGGVVVAANPYDRALPGTADEDVRYDGGIVIWHIDERVLRDGFASNRVNSNPDRRAVDVEEADGAQDLGFGNGGVALGTPFDFWYEGNPATAITANGAQIQLYENRFGPDTFPSSNSSEGGPSFVELTDFSVSAASMSLNVQIVSEGVSGIQPRSGLSGRLPFLTDSTTTITPLGVGGSEFVVFQQTTAPGERGTLHVLSGSGEFLYGLDGVFGAAAVTPDGYLAILGDSFAGSLRLRLLDAAGVVMSYSYELDGDVKDTRFGGALIPVGEDFYVRAETDTGGRVVRLERENNSESFVATGTVSDVGSIAYDEGMGLIAVGQNQVWVQNGTDWILPSPGSMAGIAAFGQDIGGFAGVVPDSSGFLTWLLPDGITRMVDPRRFDASGTSHHAYPVLADLDGDGFLDVLTISGRSLVAFTQAGAVVDGFPIDLSSSVVAQPLVAKLSASGGWSVVVSTLDGSIYAYDLGERGRLVPGFPLAVGSTIIATPALVGGSLYAIAEDGTTRAWTLGLAGDVAWGRLFQDVGNRSVSPAIQGSGPNGGAASLLDETETYNWPNPIREGRTFLRFRTGEDAEVSIMIVDLAGALVDELDAGSVRGGVPTALEWRTYAPSGVYFARV